MPVVLPRLLQASHLEAFMMQATSNKVDFVKKAQTVSKFKGLATAMAGSFPCAGTFWFSYELGKHTLHTSV